MNGAMRDILTIGFRRCLIVCGFGLIGPWRGSLTRS